MIIAAVTLAIMVTKLHKKKRVTVVQPVKEEQPEFNQTKLKSPNHSVKQGWLLLGIGLGVIVSWGATTLFSAETNIITETPAEEFSATAQAVTTTKVETTEILRTLQASGTVAASELIPVSSQATGLQITEILVDEGDWVEKGQVLAQLNNNILLAQLLEKKAAVSQAQARLAELEAGTRTEELTRAAENVNSAQAALVKAESDLVLAETRLERNQQLATEGAISRDQLEEIINDTGSKRSSLEQAQAYLKETQAQLAELEQGARPEVILQAKAQLAQAEAQLNLVQTELKQTEVVAPVRGKIAKRNARVGDLTGNNIEMFQIIEAGRLQVQLKVPETLIREVKPGQMVKLETNQDSNPNLLGTVKQVNPLIDETSRQGIVEVDLPLEMNLQPGMFLRAGIITETVSVLTIPLNAVLPQTDGTGIVYILENQKVKSREVEIGEILPQAKIEIKNGLHRADVVVVEGAAYLREGDRVRVL